ncbi:sensor histidine kinase [Microbacterium sp. NPDC055903]
MTTDPVGRTDAAAHRLQRDRRLARSITATWWYTASAVIFFELAVVFIAAVVLLQVDHAAARVSVVGFGGLVWVAATAVPLMRYRHKEAASEARNWWAQLDVMLIFVAYAIAAGLASGLWVVAGFAILQPLVLLNWPRGIRSRVVMLSTAVLIALWIVDQQSSLLPADLPERSNWWLLGFFAILLPFMSVLSLWWWDVLVTLDQARAAEARLAVTEERLRIATDVHDLQGHHLQVIALQLELAERLMADDADAGMAQLRLARESVDEARQGTRDLATRFRAVPLGDEIANAVDLLRAAGAGVEATVDAVADRAPASVLGPVIRETTTNVLRHGGGRRARLLLRRSEAGWRYEITNDVGDAEGAGDGSGLEGIARRVKEAGGSVDVVREGNEFAVRVVVPEETR